MSKPKRPQGRGKPSSDRRTNTRTDYARMTAAKTLEVVPSDGVSLDEAFDRRAEGLSPRDRGFAWRLARTAMRYHGPLQHLMTEMLERGRSGVPPFVQAVLRLGLTDLLILETPAHAAVSTTVNLLGTRSTHRYRGMVNAVLRRADRERETFRAMLDAQPAIPHWLAERWREQWGEAEVALFDQVLRQEAPVDLCLAGKNEDLSEVASKLPTGQWRFADGFSAWQDSDLGQTRRWWVQDFGANQPIFALGDVKGQTAIDLCSAPGGKTLQLVQAGADVTSVDSSAARLKRVHQNLERTGLKAAVKQADVMKYSHKPVDLVVLDAPCSASGTFRKNPEAPWLRSPTTLLEHVKVQAKMLDKAIELVKPGGTLLYIVCSLEKAEGEEQAEAFLGRHDNVSLVPFAAEDLALPETLTDQGTIRILPSHYADNGGVDGFFAARFRVA